MKLIHTGSAVLIRENRHTHTSRQHAAKFYHRLTVDSKKPILHPEFYYKLSLR